MNVIHLIGRLGKDPELQYGASGKAVAKFSVATDDGYGERKETTWHNVVVFGNTAEACARFLTKGSTAAVTGRQTHRTYEKKGGGKGYFSEVVADRVEFLNGSPERAQEPVEPDIDQDSLPF